MLPSNAVLAPEFWVVPGYHKEKNAAHIIPYMEEDKSAQIHVSSKAFIIVREDVDRDGSRCREIWCAFEVSKYVRRDLTRMQC